MPIASHGIKESSSAQSHRCDRSMCGRSGQSYNLNTGRVTSHCSTWQSIANCAVATWSASASRTCATWLRCRPVKFELTEQTRDALDNYLRATRRQPGQCLFPGRGQEDKHLTTRQYARLLGDWIKSVGLDRTVYGTHSLRRTKATLIYKRTGNLRAVQLLLGHTKIESTVRYLGIEVDDALEIAEQVDI